MLITIKALTSDREQGYARIQVRRQGLASRIAASSYVRSQWTKQQLHFAVLRRSAGS